MVYYNVCFLLSALLFVIGMVGIFKRSDLIMKLLSLELILLSVNVNFVSFAFIMNDNLGYIFSIIILAVAAAEAAVGLAIFLNHFRYKKSISMESTTDLQS